MRVSVRATPLLVIYALGAGTSGCGGPTAPTPTTQPSIQASAPHQADFEVHVDIGRMREQRVTVDEVKASLTAFFESTPFFSLSDLQDLGVRTARGATVSLRAFATIDVWFGAARTEIVVGPEPRPTVERPRPANVEHQ